MKNDFYRWLTVFTVLMIIMSLSSFLALFIKPIIFISKRELLIFQLLIICF